ncbi:FGGY carbohydrate kinase domain-containing protein-like [Salvelinus sp. IW2-2015]|uniref:FGGY carbohydrate kinase domain-containing protein-like n=1 Tax=Salvelinus sp. IW2-2015 TaxID=2691554 RepID=UPI0038D3E1CA
MAALVTREGQMKTTAEEPVTIWEPHSDQYVQSSTDIWSKCLERGDVDGRITSTGHRVLGRVGGVISSEMQPPKLLWLKANMRETCWWDAAHFLDLLDFLSWKDTGVIGADMRGFCLPCEDQLITLRMALICGTSSCHMAISQGPLIVPGVWTPYLSAMVPDLWLNEGGQSATGRLIDHVVKGHAAYPKAAGAGCEKISLFAAKSYPSKQQHTFHLEQAPH